MRQVFDDGPAVTQALEAGPTLGIVNPALARDRFTLARVQPAPDLADLVDWHWVITWDLPPGATFTQAVVPHPVGQVVAEDAGFLAYAMPAAAVDQRTLSGSGGVVGTKLRPGGYRALLGLTHPGERGAVGPATILGPTAPRAATVAIDQARDGRADAAVRTVTPLLRAAAERTRTPRSTAALAALGEAFAMIADAVPGTTVAELTAGLGTTPRTLQRLFADWVGVGPKWVLQRHRVHLAAELLGREPEPNLAGLAAAVGYYDQAHFTGDFARVFGVAPGEYARRCASARARVRV
ncbi:AraC family transcriptional regulator [Myceligenerans pegani]|uniref:AraC family transcriptional regulator n=1 Tax=Myceligenerans pegani TaxID=2776917 RepID=A0ABR9MY71_9MICO|nr:helix-turn-helix domain-containing protein [Myceligenerans sp. TRM 65318]MBE1876333.1 AraC family transcriptional regulator [Myceligenerans sp. TRM 65318]MBE3018604.1 AraC family transcriptional regulator [Myceligenerans sp. TRM 65318]